MDYAIVLNMGNILIGNLEGINIPVNSTIKPGKPGEEYGYTGVYKFRQKISLKKTGRAGLASPVY